MQFAVAHDGNAVMSTSPYLVSFSARGSNGSSCASARSSGKEDTKRGTIARRRADCVILGDISEVRMPISNEEHQEMCRERVVETEEP